MKKITIILICVASVFSAYSEDGSKFHIGVHAFPSLAWIKTDSENLKADGSKFGFGYGLIVDFKFADHYAFSTGIDVAYRGGKLKSSSVNGNTSVVSSTKFTMQFIELPITLKLKTNEIGYMTYFLRVGGAPGYLIRAKKDEIITTQDPVNGTHTTEHNGVDAMDNINDFNLSLLVSLGTEYNISGNTSLMFGVTFNNGFVDILDGVNLKGYSNYLALDIGVLF